MLKRKWERENGYVKRQRPGEMGENEGKSMEGEGNEWRKWREWMKEVNGGKVWRQWMEGKYEGSE